MGQLQPTPAHPALDPDDVLSAVKDALEALQKAFRTNDPTTKREQADIVAGTDVVDFRDPS